VECWLWASIRVRRDEDLGVTLLAKKALSGVEPSSLSIGDRAGGGLAASGRTDTEEEGREGLGDTRRCWAARRGVMGCFAFAILGSRGFVLSVGMARLCELGPHDHCVLAMWTEPARLARRGSCDAAAFAADGERREIETRGQRGEEGSRYGADADAHQISESRIWNRNDRHRRRFLALLFCSNKFRAATPTSHSHSHRTSHSSSDLSTTTKLLLS
jgi:hypothetical protein